MNKDIIEIDGSQGEGGGQLLRNAAALATIIARPIRIYNIRKKRRNPGLRPQHMQAIDMISQLCRGEVTGLKENSSEIQFYPKKLQQGYFSSDIGTAGSITLFLQCIFPVLAFIPGKTDLSIKGGTSVKWSPPYPYMTNVFLPILSKNIGFRPNVTLVRRGYYPKGGGVVNIQAGSAKKLQPITLIERGEIEKIEGISYCSKLPQHVAERQANSAKRYLQNHGYNDVFIKVTSDNNSISAGSGCVLWAKSSSGAIIGSNALGEREKKAEIVGKESAEHLISQLKQDAPVDKFLTDQLIIWMAITEGISRISCTELTMHTKSAIELCETIIGTKFSINHRKEEPIIIECRGVNPSEVQN